MVGLYTSSIRRVILSSLWIRRVLVRSQEGQLSKSRTRTHLSEGGFFALRCRVLIMVPFLSGLRSVRRQPSCSRASPARTHQAHSECPRLVVRFAAPSNDCVSVLRHLHCRHQRSAARSGRAARFRYGDESAYACLAHRDPSAAVSRRGDFQRGKHGCTGSADRICE